MAAGAELDFSPQNAPDLPLRGGAWSMQRGLVANLGDEPLNVVGLAHAESAPLRLYGRRFQAPPRAVRRFAFPLFVAQDAAQQGEATIRSQLLLGDAADREQVVEPRATGASTAPVEREKLVVGLLGDDAARRLVQRAKIIAGHSPRIYALADDWSLPPSAELLQGFDCLVVASDRLLEDPQGLIAVRQWLTRGGRLWLALDRVSAELPAALLGDAWQAAEWGRTTVVEAALQDVRGGAAREPAPPAALTEPAAWVQLDGGPAEVDFRLAEWPAALWLRIGRGSVLCTALGPSAWLSELDADDRIDLEDARQWPGLRSRAARLPLGILARRLFADRADEAPEFAATATLASTASQQIGQRTLSRAVIAGVLGGCCLTATLLAAGLQRAGRPWHALASLPILAAVVAAAVAAVGRAQRTALPVTFSAMEVIRLAPETGEYDAEGAFALYRADATVAEATGGGAPWRFEPAGGETALRRVVWTDLDRWSINATRIPAGISPGSWTAAGSLGPSWQMRTTVNDRGLEGKLALPRALASPTGVIASGRGPALLATLAADGSFAAPIDAELPAGRISAAALIDERTRRREELLQTVLRAGDRGGLSGPTLFCWSDNWLPEASWTAADQRVGEALVVAPLRLSRPPAGAALAIPAALIPFASVASPDGAAPSSAYSNEKGAWVEGLVNGTAVSLRFQLPPELLPLRVVQARLSTEVHAPGRRVRWLQWQGDRPREAGRAESPDGRRLDVEFSDPQGLALDPQGGLVLTIHVGSHPDEAAGSLSRSGWHVRQAFLAARAVALPRPETRTGEPE
jgi:hypothetical protein